ncbi:MAG: hypothetical protein RLZZ127_1981 [Planctomycetota bacterium]|jgi:hypothetical protein
MSQQRLTVMGASRRLLAWDGAPRIWIGSGEHYGALINRAFDHRRYLDTLAADGLDHIRLFLGTYVELPGQFGIDGNSLAPPPGERSLAWVRDADGRHDLGRIDPDHLDRLGTILAAAAARGIAVGLCLFCPCYSDEQWQAHPFHPANNRQGAGDGTVRGRMLVDPGLRPWQERLLDAVLPVAAAAGGAYIDLCNEPYQASPDRAIQREFAVWQRWLAAEVRRRAPQLPIAVNPANRAIVLRGLLPPEADIACIHYPAPEAASLNYGCGTVVAGDETGFQGQEDAVYRRQAWEFCLAGGALYSHLDYSFTAAHPDGTASITARTPGWGGPALRRQLAFLRRTLAGQDALRLQPCPEVIDIALPQGVQAAAIGIPDEAYLLHLRAWPGGALRCCLAPGAWDACWIDPAGCRRHAPVAVMARGPVTPLTPPADLSAGADLAVELVRRG